MTIPYWSYMHQNNNLNRPINLGLLSIKFHIHVMTNIFENQVYLKLQIYYMINLINTSYTKGII